MNFKNDEWRGAKEMNGAKGTGHDWSIEVVKVEVHGGRLTKV